jgi:DNA-binding GntR family transcriptional regulator
MEVQANIWALQRITPEELAALDNLKSEILNLDDTAGNKHMIELDFKVHRILFNATQNDRLAKLLERLLSHYLRFWLSIPRQIVPKLFFTEVLEMIQAIEKKDEERLRKISIAHIENSVNEIMSALSTFH